MKRINITISYKTLDQTKIENGDINNIPEDVIAVQINIYNGVEISNIETINYFVGRKLTIKEISTNPNLRSQINKNDNFATGAVQLDTGETYLLGINDMVFENFSAMNLQLQYKCEEIITRRQNNIKAKLPKQ